MPIYFSVHCLERGDKPTLKMWPSYAHARTDIHLQGEKYLNKGLEQVSKVITDGNLTGLSFRGPDNSLMVMSVHSMDEVLYDERLKKFLYPEWVTYNSFTHRLQPLKQYVDARVHLADYAMVTKEYNEFNWLSDKWHLAFDKAFDDMESVQDEELPCCTIELEKGTATYWKVAKHHLFGTSVRRDLLQSYRKRDDLGDYIQHDMV